MALVGNMGSEESLVKGLFVDRQCSVKPKGIVKYIRLAPWKLLTHLGLKEPEDRKDTRAHRAKPKSVKIGLKKRCDLQ